MNDEFCDIVALALYLKDMVGFMTFFFFQMKKFPIVVPPMGCKFQLCISNIFNPFFYSYVNINMKAFLR